MTHKDSSYHVYKIGRLWDLLPKLLAYFLSNPLRLHSAPSLLGLETLSLVCFLRFFKI